MIKVETLGMIDIAKVNPVLKSEADVANYSFLTVDGDLYLIANTLTGDDAYRDDVAIKAGEFLNGFMVKAWEGQKLVVDAKHIVGTYADIAVDTFMSAGTDGKLKVEASEPTSGVYFKVTDKCRLTENAVKVKVMVA